MADPLTFPLLVSTLLPSTEGSTVTGSNSINFRSERLWILRLIYAGLNLDEDGQLFIYNSVMKELLSLYTSPLSDDESKKLILHVIIDVVSSRGIVEWLQNHALEQLMGLASHVYKVVVGTVAAEETIEDLRGQGRMWERTARKLKLMF
ncbi:hypothetical protein LINPERPRIM_LOCUS6110 [Linum perenne]